MQAAISKRRSAPLHKATAAKVDPSEKGASAVETPAAMARDAGHRESLPKKLPDIRLKHGSALCLLEELGFGGTTNRSTFKEYIKSLRKLGLPFAPGMIGIARRGRAIYAYEHLMELALALILRVYHTVPDVVLKQIIHFREPLNRAYNLAYDQRQSGRGAPVTIAVGPRRSLRLRGMFLDLNINFSGGQLVSFGPPKLLSPADALALFADYDIAARALPPINLSELAERLVAAALRLPRQERTRKAARCRK